jgi:hypothetical protein
MKNKVLWEMSVDDFKEQEGLIKAHIKALSKLPVDMNTNVWNEVFLYINEARLALQKAQASIKALAKHTNR